MTYSALVTQELHDRLEGAVTDLRSGPRLRWNHRRLRDLRRRCRLDANRRYSARTRFRIASAPRGSWAGVARDFARPEFANEDGALLMMLKQARAVYMDRIQRVVRGDSLCEHPPLFDALERNAYMLMYQDDACTVLMPGILVPPFADERYSKESLYARIGFVIAHEFMHATAVNQDPWDMRSVQALLRDYRGDHYVEAIADVGAMAALERASVANNRVLRASRSSCARTGWLDGGATAVSGAHPSGNARGDAACKFLKEHFSKRLTQPRHHTPPRTRRHRRASAASGCAQRTLRALLPVQDDGAVAHVLPQLPIVTRHVLLRLFARLGALLTRDHRVRRPVLIRPKRGAFCAMYQNGTNMDGRSRTSLRDLARDDR